MNAPASLKPRYASQALVERMIRAARKAGLDVGGVEALPDGTVRILEARAVPQQPASLFDQLEESGQI